MIEIVPYCYVQKDHFLIIIFVLCGILNMWDLTFENSVALCLLPSLAWESSAYLRNDIVATPNAKANFIACSKVLQMNFLTGHSSYY